MRISEWPRWVFDSPARLRLCAVGLAVAVVILLVSLMTIRLSAGSDGSAEPLPSASPTVVNTEMVPPTEAATATPNPQPSYGSSIPIALVAVEAWLQGDYQRFETVAQPAALEAVVDSGVNPPGGKVNGEVETLEGGPTQQTLQVPTSGGPMELVMVISGERWQVQSIRYVK